MLFRYTCHQCGRAYYPWSGPSTPCPKCLADPPERGFQVLGWFIAMALFLAALAYLASRGVTLFTTANIVQNSELSLWTTSVNDRSKLKSA